LGQKRNQKDLTNLKALGLISAEKKKVVVIPHVVDPIQIKVLILNVVPQELHLK
jgi:hypothetical protein